MTPIEVIEYLESHPLDEEFVKILQRDYEFDLYEADIDSFLFHHYGQMAGGLSIFIGEKVEYPSPAKTLMWRFDGSLPRTLRRTTTGRLDTSEVFRRRSSYPNRSATIETYQRPDGERGLRFKYYWITLIGEDYDDVYDTENPLEDYFSDPSVREEYTYGIDEWYGEYEFAEFDLPYRFPAVMLNYPRGGIFG